MRSYVFHVHVQLHTPFTKNPSAHAAQIVLNAPVKKTMIPLNVTHTAIVTKRIHSLLLSPNTPVLEYGEPPKASSNLRYTLSTLITFFADTYKSTFGFADGPPLHDALTIAYVSCPEIFICERYRVDVELNGTHTCGETVVDVWQYRSCDDSWGSQGKNCLVAQSLDVSIPEQAQNDCSLILDCQVDNFFFGVFLPCVALCDNVSPLNK